MERSEPSLVPEWLRSTGGGTGSGNLSHHFASSQADGPVLALPRRSRSSKNISNSDGPYSPVLERSSSSNSRRSLTSNGYGKHDKSSYARPYSSFSTRNQRDRDRDRERLDDWSPEYSDPLRGMINGRADDHLRRSQSMISRRHGELPQRRITTDMRNGSHNSYDNGNGTPTGAGSAGSQNQKVSFERDFPLLGADERPKTPDVVRVSSPGLSRGMQSLSIGNSPSVGSEGWTSALVEVPTGAGSNSLAGASPALQPSVASCASAPSASSNSLSGVVSTSSGLNMAETLVQAPGQLHNNLQPSVHSQRDELALAQSKKLIPMTPLFPKTMVLSSSDKLKPKTAMRTSETVVAPKNGVHHLSPLQLGSQTVRVPNVRADGPKSPSGMLLLKPGRENGVPPVLKDLQSPTANVSGRVANGQSAGSSVASTTSKTVNNPKALASERKTSAFGLNTGPAVDKRPSFAQAQSRSSFFKLMREKSMNSTPGMGDTGTVGSSIVVDNSDNEAKELSSSQEKPAATGNESKCNGETCTVAESLSNVGENDNATHEDDEELAFLKSLGWEPRGNNAGDDEGLTEEEILAFCTEVMKQTPSPRLRRVLQAKVFSQVGLSGAASNEPSTPASQTESLNLLLPDSS